MDAAILSMIHSFGKADLAIAATAAGIGILIAGGRSMYDTYEKLSGAEAGLSQAVGAHNSLLGDQSKKSAELAKAQKELTAVKRQLFEYDLAHHAVASKTSADLKGHAKDLKAAERASKELHSAQITLENWDLSHTGHVLNAAQLRQREQHLRAVTSAQKALGKASGDAATIDSVSTKAHKLSASELAHRQDLLDKVTEAQQAVNDETKAGGAGAKAQALDFDQVKASADQLIASNRRYISDQSQVYDGYGKLIRSGLSLHETQRVLNDAVDLSAIKHISLSEAVDILSNAEHGRMRGLIDLGITTKGLTDKNGNLLGGQRAISAAMGEVDKKVAHGRETLAQTTQRSNELNNAWQDLSKKGGPVIETLLLTVTGLVLGLYNAFDSLGKNDDLWGAISDRLSAIAGWIRDWIIIPLQNLYNLGLSPTDPNRGQVFMTTAEEAHVRAASQRTGAFGKGGRASGGPVMPNGTYRVGEEGEELLVMGARGGYVIPNSGAGKGRGGHTFHITVQAQTNADPYEIATEVGWEVRKLLKAGA